MATKSFYFIIQRIIEYYNRDLFLEKKFKMFAEISVLKYYESI